jgi:hypothetical protein
MLVDERGKERKWRQERILIVDDEADVSLITLMLRHHSFLLHCTLTPTKSHWLTIILRKGLW